ncbi:helix-turn-helix transcriptional regulator [Thermogemmatispora sp.]|uniref:helix-turn-helix domain-containing protein n=1 Tax=Thermogemmatispora sp. TaxID=1968838 RepID=UPI002ACBDD93|nr:helix-turn-helix transcriptional regulator [Thermogemmatispora sp.]
MKETKDSLKRFGQALRQRREACGLTRDDLVDHMSTLASERYPDRRVPDVSTVARWERGKQCPRRFHLRLVCEVLQVKPEELGYPKPIRRWP